MKQFLLGILVLVAWALPVHAAETPYTDNLVIQAGESYSYIMQFSDSNGDPLDLDGRTYAGQIRTTATASTTLAAFTITVEANQVTASLSKTVTASLSGKSGVYDIRETTADSTVNYLVKGSVMFVPTVTR